MIAESLKSREAKSLESPFPGLRPFDFRENDLFFGRDGQSEELLIKLTKTHFLAVVGTSGSGKSSLVRAGLMPALYGGLMGKAGSGWRIAVLRPGNDPIGNLARALNEPGVLGLGDNKTRDIQTQVNLRRGSLGLVESVRQARLEPHENLLIIVDQFEELFRFARISEDEAYANEAAAFVKLLLEAKGQSNLYVVLTMRSEYLGDCARFWDLPEAINQGQYLIPRMTREDRREAIIGPLGVRGVSITPGLVNQLVNAMGEDSGQLPVLQHALMRIWNEWRAEGDLSKPLDVSHFEKTGGLTETLSRHADEAYERLSGERSRAIAERLFKCLTEKGMDDRETRRPTSLKDICLVTGARKKEVKEVIDIFRAEGRSFLMPPESVPLKNDSSIDISHESLISGWYRLKQWVEEEANSTRIYRRLTENALVFGPKGPLADPWLQEALDWREQHRPNRAWASRHHGRFYALLHSSNETRKKRDRKIFKMAMDYLDESKKARDERIAAEVRKSEQELRQTRRFVAVLAVTLIIIFGLAVAAWILRGTALDRSRMVSLLNYRTTMNLAQKAYETGNLGEANQLLSTFPIRDQQDLRGLDWYYLWRSLHDERGVLRGKLGPINSVAFSPDDRIIATGNKDRTVTLWDAKTLEWLRDLKGHQNAILAIAFSSDGKTLATGSVDQTVKLWDTSTGQVLNSINTSRIVRSVAFAKGSNNRLAIGTDDGNVRVLNPAMPQAIEPLINPSPPVRTVAFSPNGEVIVSGSADGKVKLWDAHPDAEPKQLEEAELAAGRSNGILSVTFSPDGQTVAASTESGVIKLWRGDLRGPSTLLNDQADLTGRANPAVWSLAFAGKILVSGNGDTTLRLWDVDTGKLLGTLKGHSKEILCVATSSDGQTIVTGSADATAKLWDVNAQTGTQRLMGHSGNVLSVAFSVRKESSVFASGGADGSIKLWDANTRQELRTFQEQDHQSRVLSVAFSPDDKMIAGGSADGTVKLWNVTTGQLIGTFRGHTKDVSSVAFSADGKTLASGSMDNTVKLWDLETEKELMTLTHSGMVWSCAFSPDGTIIAAGGADGTIRLWDAHSGNERGQLRGHEGGVLSLAFSHDGKLLASGSADNTAILWDAQTRKALTTLIGHTNAVLSLAFSPGYKNQRLITASYDGSVKFWDTSGSAEEPIRRQELATLKSGFGDSQPLRSLALSPDGVMIVTGREDGSLEIWRAASDEETKMQH